MRRASRIGLLAVIIVLLVLGGAYTAFWFVAASRIEQGVADAAQTLRAQNLELTWKSLDVSGYPLSLRVELGQPVLRSTAGNPRGEVHAPLLSASAHPWNFHIWQLAAPEGIVAEPAPGSAPGGRISAKAMTGSLVASDDAGATLWLHLDAPAAALGEPISARSADLWLQLPPHPPVEHTEPAFGAALLASDVRLARLPAPLHNPLDEIAVAVTMKGPISRGPLRQAAQAWRDAGGTLELDNFVLRSGSLAIAGSGTLALDSDLQPTGAFSGSLEGANELLNALVASGVMRAGDARLAQVGLAFLTKRGADGRPQISTSFTIQNGQMYLGPVKLGPAPRIAW
jgi:hypothetical protein